ncbi:MAG: protein kinase [Planctomycetes bacterium]|nr:protein kinase [Planctomycetota bacterium]MCW8135683.1 protein kinase [Planctomycetota bacterium]
MARAKVRIVDGIDAGIEKDLPEEGSTTIGRRSSCDLVLRVDSVSREHCRIERQDGAYWIYDNGSSNGTLLNGLRIEKAKLVHGDVITLDRVTLEYIEDSDSAHTREMIREFVVQKRPDVDGTYTAENSLIGKTLKHYKVLSVIGEGGMALVYKARDERNGDIVALKVLKRGETVDQENLQRFLKEFKTGSKLNHPNIMQVYEIGEVDGTYFIAMEYINGSSLQEILDEKGRLSAEGTLKIGIQVAKALEFAFSQRIIHRDIKPENILISREGEVKITDLGLAKELKRYVSVNITKTGEGIGTLHYMSPEQVENTRDVDQRADIYSLGATLYECLCGQPPFDEVGVWKFVEAINEKPPPDLNERVPNLHPEIWPAVSRTLAKRPEERHQTPTELREDLERLLALVQADRKKRVSAGEA